MAKIIKQEEANIVWSDDPNFKKKEAKKKLAPLVPSETLMSIRLEKKGRGGKTVTVIYGFPDGHDEAKKLTKKLKRFVGSGGTFKGDSIEIQGDFKTKCGEYLESEGYMVKFTGG